MPGTVVLNPAAVDGYGNPISVERDVHRGVNRVLTTTKVEGQPHIELFDASGNPVTIYTDGGRFTISVRDEEQLDYLHKIHIQLKKMNHYLSHMVDEDLDDNDVEDEDEQN